MKSTVPPGTGARVSETLAPVGVDYTSNPEFLREGSAVHDWFQADRIVLGGPEAAVERVAALYEGIDAPIVRCGIASAELIKYASNAFLATKISFANEIARLCDRLDADVDLVMHGVGLDPRIGPAFLKAGIGYGGSCFPKDTKALDYLSSLNGYDFHLLKAVIDVNKRQRLLPIMTLKSVLGDLRGQRIAVAGLTFKPNTDDIREAPALEIIDTLVADGAQVKGYDPVGVVDAGSSAFEQTATLAEAVRGANAVVIATEWPEIASADWRALATAMDEPRLVFDGRNCVDGDAVRAGGGTYVGVGRR
jgi:UDPglucose 6-dehydrogenase